MRYPGWPFPFYHALAAVTDGPFTPTPDAHPQLLTEPAFTWLCRMYPCSVHSVHCPPDFALILPTTNPVCLVLLLNSCYNLRTYIIFILNVKGPAIIYHYLIVNCIFLHLIKLNWLETLSVLWLNLTYYIIHNLITQELLNYI